MTMLVDEHTGEIISAGSDLVPVAVASSDLDRADVTAAMVTQALVESRSWLAVAMKGTDPTPIAEFKAWAATVEEATRQKQLGHEIELDAAEMVRRAERGIGVAIRNGQAAGQIAGNGQRLNRGLPDEKSSPADYFTGGGETADVYSVTDRVTDEAFEEAIAEAKSEGNLSRANVVRKIAPNRTRPEPKPTGRPAVLHKMRRLDSNRIVGQTVEAASHLDAMLAEVTYSDLDRTNLEEWISSLSESIKALRSLRSNLERELNR